MKRIDEQAFLKSVTLKMQDSAFIAYGDGIAMNLLYNWGFTDSKGGNDLGKVSYCIVEPQRFVERLSNYIHTCFSNNGESKRFKGKPQAFALRVTQEVALQMSRFKKTNDTPYDMAIREPHIYGRGTISHGSSGE